MGKVAKVSAGRPAWVTEGTVVGDVMEIDVPQTVERYEDIRIRYFDFGEKEVSSGRGGKYERINLLRLLIHLWLGTWREQLKEINRRVEKENEKKQGRTKSTKFKLVIENEFYFWGGLYLLQDLKEM